MSKNNALIQNITCHALEDSVNQSKDDILVMRKQFQWKHKKRKTLVTHVSPSHAVEQATPEKVVKISAPKPASTRSQDNLGQKYQADAISQPTKKQHYPSEEECSARSLLLIYYIIVEDSNLSQCLVLEIVSLSVACLT